MISISPAFTNPPTSFPRVHSHTPPGPPYLTAPSDLPIYRLRMDILRSCLFPFSLCLSFLLLFARPRPHRSLSELFIRHSSFVEYVRPGFFHARRRRSCPHVRTPSPPHLHSPARVRVRCPPSRQVPYVFA
ncbi:hypothetical protein C8Q76DRAFT_407879 [Earliella scabrosa]|nr:hypothetical protein C8Q76DRAFT_407879 [Earliella scabrosa]